MIIKKSNTNIYLFFLAQDIRILLLIFSLFFSFSVLLFTPNLVAKNNVVAGYLPVDTVVVVRGERPPIDLSKVDAGDYYPGLFRVKFNREYAALLESGIANKSGITSTGISDFDQFCQQNHISHGRQIIDILPVAVNKSSSVIAGRHRQWGFHLWYEFYTSNKSDIIPLIRDLQELESIEFAQPVFRIVDGSSDRHFEEICIGTEQQHKDAPATNDPGYANQWSLHNTGQNGGKPGADIRMPQAWNITRGHSGVVVAVIDGGIQLDHPDLAANIWINDMGLSGYNFANDTTVLSANNHGTHVAGIIAAVSGNATGIAGIAGGSELQGGVKLMSCQVFSDNRTGGFHLAPVYAADNGAAISQNSWTYAAPNVYDHLALDAIDYFNTYGGGDVLQGGITVFAAGNRSSNASFFPAAYSGTIAVASTDNRDKKVSSSNYGEWVDISAPGDRILSTLNRGGYGVSSGTSMAAPHVTAAAALLISAAPGELTANEVIEILLTTADSHYAVNESHAGMLGSGRLNTYEALRKLLSLPQEAGDDEAPEEGNDEHQEEPGDTPTEPKKTLYFLNDGSWHDLRNWYSDSLGLIQAEVLPSSNCRIHIHAEAMSEETIMIGDYGYLFLEKQSKLTTTDIYISQNGKQTSRLTISPNASLDVRNDLINHDGPAAVLIIADESGSGSIINHTSDVGATIRLIHPIEHITAHTLAIPLSEQRICSEALSGQVYAWDEARQSWVDLTAKSDNRANFVPGIGYLANLSKSANNCGSLFSGNLSSGVIQFGLSRMGQHDHSFAGYNLLGNPYPSSIDWKNESGWEGRELLESVNQSPGYSFWVWNPVTGNYGAYNNMSQSDLGTNLASRYIKPLQAFWVRAATHGATFSVNDQARAHKSSIQENGEKKVEGFRLLVTNRANNYSDEVAVEFGHNRWGGAEKIFSFIEEAPSLYTHMNSKEMSIHFVAEQPRGAEIPLGFIPGVHSIYTISASGHEALADDLFITDLHTGQRHNLSMHNEYHFHATPGDEQGRFVLHVGEVISTNANVIAEEGNHPIVYYDSGNLHMVNPWPAAASVRVYNIAGVCVETLEAQPNGTSRSSFSHTPGVYVVRMSDLQEEYTTKIAAW